MKYQTHDCEYCKLPLKGGVTGINYCICDNPIEMDKCRSFVKNNCSVCGMDITENDNLKRYFRIGNYCTRCANKKPTIPRQDEGGGKSYAQYLKSAGYKPNGIKI
jgi:hypothetical protein